MTDTQPTTLTARTGHVGGADRTGPADQNGLLDLHGQHVLVAGGGRGIGAATAIMAARAGAAVSITYREDSTSAEQTVAAITATGGRACAYATDIADEQATHAVTDAAVRDLGPLTGLVVSAGIYADGWRPIAETSLDYWNQVMAINLTGTFLAVRAALPHLRQAPTSSIVIITSTAGQRGAGGNAAYATSKGAQITLMRSLAQEFAEDRIRVNCVAPAWTDTGTAIPLIDRFGRDNIVANAPLGRVGLPDDSAGAICYLLSDLAVYVTGSTLTVDGGQDMRG